MKQKDKLWLLIFIIVFVMYEELVFSLATFNSISLYTILFSFPVGGTIYLFLSVFKGKFNHILTYIVLVLFTILFSAQLVYYDIYQSVISLYSFIGGGQVLQFMDKIINTILSNIFIVLLFILPIIIFVFLDIKKVFSYSIETNKSKLFFLISLICFHFVIVLSMDIVGTKELYSNKNLYHNVNAPLLTVNRMGIITEMRLDLERLVLGFEENNIVVEEISNNEEESKEKDIIYNVMEIDFDDLIDNETDQTIKDMDEYFSKQTPSSENEYTGMFEGKNLIVFVAEAFSQMAINKEVTPTLYKLYNEGFQFDNFYNPVFPVSTADGEYITDTSLIPKEGVWSLYRVKDNYMPFSYANVFESIGYTSQAYHDNTATYYHRSDYIKAMGYDSFRACKAGLNINCKQWPESDYEMIMDTTGDYINDDNFVSYYMSVSGHLEYTRTGNMMVTKNWNSVKNLNYSDKAKSYLACNIELDKAIAELISRLEEAGKLDDTVIALSPDHYPYGLSIDEINELSTYTRDENFEIHHSAFLVWNSEMEKSVKVEKYGSSLDVLPTLLNLFGIDYDSRLLMGRDILSDSNPLVIFSNRSFITDKGRYNSVTKEFIKADGVDEIENNYVDNISAIIYNKYKYSKLILDEDYYRKLYTKLGLEIR